MVSLKVLGKNRFSKFHPTVANEEYKQVPPCKIEAGTYSSQETLVRRIHRDNRVYETREAKLVDTCDCCPGEEDIFVERNICRMFMNDYLKIRSKWILSDENRPPTTQGTLVKLFKSITPRKYVSESFGDNKISSPTVRKRKQHLATRVAPEATDSNRVLLQNPCPGLGVVISTGKQDGGNLEFSKRNSIECLKESLVEELERENDQNLVNEFSKDDEDSHGMHSEENPFQAATRPTYFQKASCVSNSVCDFEGSIDSNSESFHEKNQCIKVGWKPFVSNVQNDQISICKESLDTSPSYNNHVKEILFSNGAGEFCLSTEESCRDQQATNTPSAHDPLAKPQEQSSSRMVPSNYATRLTETQKTTKKIPQNKCFTVKALQNENKVLLKQLEETRANLRVLQQTRESRSLHFKSSQLTTSTLKHNNGGAPTVLLKRNDTPSC